MFILNTSFWDRKKIILSKSILPMESNAIFELTLIPIDLAYLYSLKFLFIHLGAQCLMHFYFFNYSPVVIHAIHFLFLSIFKDLGLR